MPNPGLLDDNGRPVGNTDGSGHQRDFLGTGYAYTPAMKASGVVWTPAELDRFLQGPRKLIPGTAMSVTVNDPVQRRDLIAYLGTLKAR